MLTNPAFWVGIVFAAVLVAFLMYSAIKTPKQTSAQTNIVKFLASICAGASATFISGSAVFDAQWTTAGGKVAISGTSGAALFLIVFFYYNRKIELDDAVEFDIPPNSTFRQAADRAAELGNVTVDYTALTGAELAQPMAAGHISCDTFVQLFATLRLRTSTVGAIRNYNVTETNNIYRFLA